MCCPSWRLLAATWAFLVEGQLVVLVLRTTCPATVGQAPSPCGLGAVWPRSASSGTCGGGLDPVLFPVHDLATTVRDLDGGQQNKAAGCGTRYGGLCGRLVRSVARTSINVPLGWACRSSFYDLDLNTGKASRSSSCPPPAGGWRC